MCSSSSRPGPEIPCSSGDSCSADAIAVASIPIVPKIHKDGTMLLNHVQFELFIAPSFRANINFFWLLESHSESGPLVLHRTIWLTVADGIELLRPPPTGEELIDADRKNKGPKTCYGTA